MFGFNYIDRTLGGQDLKGSKKQKELLPYYKELNVDKINGINFYNPSINNIYNHHNCSYKKVNKDYINTEPETDVNPQFIGCYNCSGSKILIYNKNNVAEPITFGDTNYYCYKHKQIMIHEYLLKEKTKEKELKKQEKELKKQEKAKEKAKEKELKKQEKAKA